MKTVFELKNGSPFDLSVFEDMKRAAEDLLKGAGDGEYTQAVVLYSSTCQKHGALIKNALSAERSDERDLLDELKTDGDTRISYCLAMWKDGNIDLPSFKFREMIEELNAENRGMLMFVMTRNGASVMELSASMK